MRYNNAIISSTSDFGTWWKNLANEFKSDSRVIFDIMNEPHVRAFQFNVVPFANFFYHRIWT
jgi:aryl-phospho-beta-D-glucosidase BglC (GH1 family)